MWTSPDFWKGVSVLAAIIAGLAGLFYANRSKFVKTISLVSDNAVKNLASVSDQLQHEQAQLAKIRSERVTEVTLKLAEVETQMQALKQLYAGAIMSLEQASIREATLKKKVEEQEIKINEQTSTISALRARIEQLENK